MKGFEKKRLQIVRHFSKLRGNQLTDIQIRTVEKNLADKVPFKTLWIREKLHESPWLTKLKALHLRQK
jgi:hypothetical protein